MAGEVMRGTEGRRSRLREYLPRVKNTDARHLPYASDIRYSSLITRAEKFYRRF